MKKIILLALLIVGTTIVAQERNRKAQGMKMEQFTAEQKSQLMLKKMTLLLDLSDAQQKDMSVLISNDIAQKEANLAEMKAMREKRVRPSKDDRFTMQIKMLDKKIAAKKNMKKILDAKQYEKWIALKEDHPGKPQGNRQGSFPRKRTANPERKG